MAQDNEVNCQNQKCTREGKEGKNLCVEDILKRTGREEKLNRYQVVGKIRIFYILSLAVRINIFGALAEPP